VTDLAGSLATSCRPPGRPQKRSDDRTWNAGVAVRTADDSRRTADAGDEQRRRNTIQEAAAADGPRDALSVEIQSSEETSSTTNPRQIEVLELHVEGYSSATCSKRPRLGDCRIGVNKLDRRRRVMLISRSTCRGEICIYLLIILFFFSFFNSGVRKIFPEVP